MKNFDKEKEKIIGALDEFLKQYDEFTKKVSPSQWRLTGSHFTEIRNMKEEIKEFYEITPKEKEKVKHLI